ncbi:hypothetical protein BC351_09775 [Paenibacillus ferrarius]|uniref:VWFA domain-containing protein n=1 Tax=Paenibacillus ferrarius TaxID=1469647 RepID=A0A1V4H8F5_9BACL|nr:BatA and WFA domain-containing protein [Paenibacillus ferrarius]OPH47484.1 hypothetical protein BC351_09775 [Paenibacillus ferrarius]
MQFASLSGLWFSLAIPVILLLYMLKRRYTDTVVPSHMLWQRILREQEANRPWQRLRKHLLLFLQLLAAILLILALIQPLIRGQQAAAKAHVFFVLDASASMQASPGMKTRLDAAKQGILDYASDAAGNRSYSLLVMKDQPELILQKEASVAALQNALEKVVPFYGKTKVQEALSLASALTREEADGEVRIYTDRQWTDKIEGITFAIPVSMQDFGDASVNVKGDGNQGGNQADQGLTNVSIVQFGVKSSAQAADTRAVAVLKNWGTVSTAVKMTLYADSQPVHEESLQLKAGEQKTYAIQQMQAAKVYKLHLDVKDALETDNTAYAFPEGTGHLQAVYVGEGNLFMQKALSLANVDVLQMQKGKDGAYPIPLGLAPDLIVLDGISEVDSALQSNQWQQLLRSKPLWELASMAEAEVAVPQKASFTIAEHPVTRYLRLQDVNIVKAQLNSRLSWGKSIVSSAEVPLILAGTENGRPRLSFRFPLEQSDLALRSEFPILVQNAVAWLTEHQGGNLGRIIAGERLSIALHPEAVKAVWQTGMSGVPKQEAELVQKGLSGVQTVPLLPGLYDFVEYNLEGRELQSRLLEVIMDPRESNINAKQESSLTFQSVQGNAEKSNTGDRVGFIGLLPWLIAILLALLVVEWEVYRRGYSG